MVWSNSRSSCKVGSNFYTASLDDFSYPWFSRIAEDVGDNVAGHKNVIIDCFAGAGGNAIAFALSGRWDRIFAIEKDPAVLACAKHNATIYGVEKRIFWIQGDCFKEIKSRFKNAEMAKDAVIFASPPWGGKQSEPFDQYDSGSEHDLVALGPEYADDEVFDLDQMEPYSLHHLHKSFSQITKDFVLFLPRTSDLNQLANYATEDATLDVTHYNMNHHSKGICAYFGQFKFG